MRFAHFIPVLAIAAPFALAAPVNPAADDLIAKGDAHYQKLQPAEALRYYLPAEKLEPNNARLLVRIARQYRHLMSDAPKRDKAPLGRTALDYAQRAVTLAPNDPDTHLALAISHGKLLPLLGNKEQVANSRAIKASADRVLALDPNNDLAWQVLGRWYFNLAEVGGVKRALAKLVYGNLPPATFEDAARCYEKAIKLNPSRPLHHIELGRTYAKLGRDEEARKALTKGLGMPNTEKDDEETKQRGRELLAKLK